MNNIALVFKTGGDFTPEYVERLVAKLSPFGVVTCLTDYDGPLPCCTLPLIAGLPGWWSKMELFRVFRTGRTVYFDLDTVIAGDITPLLQVSAPFAMLSDFYAPHRPASGVMVWQGDWSVLWHEFRQADPAQYQTSEKWGDQGFIAECVPNIARLQDIEPGLIASYKASTPDQKAQAAIICYHGLPRPHQTGWTI